MSTEAQDWRKWLSRVEARRDSFAKGWWKQAEKAMRMYSPEGGVEKKAQDVPFNILYANTEVLLPSLYSASPRPDVATRHDAPQAPAKAAEQFLRTAIDDNSPGMETFDQAMEGAVLSGLVPGAGGVRLRGYPGEPHPVRWEEYKYNQLIWAATKTWARCPWIAFLHSYTREDLLSEFKLSPEKVKNLESQEAKDLGEGAGEKCDYTVVELWIKSSRRTVWLCEEVEDILVQDISTDPLKLAGFYPTPGPLTLVRKPQDLDPTPLYFYYEQQATELNRVTVRLNKVLEAIKVRGGYAASMASELGNLLDSDDMENKMVPMKNVGPDQSLDKMVWMLPIDKLISVAKELYAARAAIMNTIQQITGLADIVRGASVASETATAQELKNKWGTVRLRRMQTTVARYVRDLLRLAVDAGTSLCPPLEWRKITGLPYPLAAEKQAAEMQVQQQLAQAASMQQGPMLAGGQPPGPPPIDPKLQEVLSQPTWEEVIQLLSDDAGRCYLIDIETSSTIDADASADKQDAAEFMQAFGTLVQGMAPLAQLGPSGVNLAKTIVAAVCKRFKLGRECDEAIKALQPPPPPGPDEGEQVKLEIEKLKLSVMQQKADIDKEKAQMDMAMTREKHRLEMEKMSRQHAVDMAKIDAQNQSAAIQTHLGMVQNQQQAALGVQQHQQQTQAVAQKGQLAEASHKQKMQAAAQRPKPAPTGAK